MMKTRTTQSLMKTLDLMLMAVIEHHQSHESRNHELSVIRAMLDNWLTDFNRYTSDEDEKTEARQTLEAVYQLSIWTLDGETHRCVKNRLYLARSVIRGYFGRVETQRFINMAKRGLEKIDALEFEHVGDDLVPVNDDSQFDYPF